MATRPLIVQRDHVAVCVQPTPEINGERRTLGVPGRLLVPHPLHPHGAAQLFGQVRGLEARVVRRRAPVELRPVHPDDPHLLRRHAQELGDPGPVAVRLHVVGVDRHLAVRRVGQGVGGTDGGVPVEGDVVRGFDDGRGARQRPVGVPLPPAPRRVHPSPARGPRSAGSRRGRRRRGRGLKRASPTGPRAVPRPRSPALRARTRPRHSCPRSRPG